MTKRYTGYRLPGEQGTAAPALVTVHEEGKAPRALDRVSTCGDMPTA